MGYMKSDLAERRLLEMLQKDDLIVSHWWRTPFDELPEVVQGRLATIVTELRSIDGPR